MQLQLRVSLWPCTELRLRLCRVHRTRLDGARQQDGSDPGEREEKPSWWCPLLVVTGAVHQQRAPPDLPCCWVHYASIKCGGVLRPERNSCPGPRGANSMRPADGGAGLRLAWSTNRSHLAGMVGLERRGWGWGEKVAVAASGLETDGARLRSGCMAAFGHMGDWISHAGIKSD